MNDSSVPVLSADFDSFLSSLSTNPATLQSSFGVKLEETPSYHDQQSGVDPNSDNSTSNGATATYDATSKFCLSSLFQELEALENINDSVNDLKDPEIDKLPKKTTRLKLNSRISPSCLASDGSVNTPLEIDTKSFDGNTSAAPASSEFLGFNQIWDLLYSGDAASSGDQKEIVTTPSSTSEEVRSPLEQKLCQSNDITSSDFTSSQMTSSCGLQGSSDAPKKTTRITRRFGASARKGKIPPNNISLPSSEIRSASNSSTPEATVQSQNFVVTPFFTEYSEPTSTCMRMKTKQSPVSPSEDQIREFIPPILSPKLENAQNDTHFVMKPLEMPLVKSRRIRPKPQTVASPSEVSENASNSGSDHSANRSSKKCYSKADMLRIAEKSRSFEIVPEFFFLTDDIKFTLQAGLKVANNHEPLLLVSKEFEDLDFSRVCDPHNCLLRV